MYITEKCAQCLYTKQEETTKDPGYLQEVRTLLDRRRKEDTAPYMVYLFDQAYRRRFGTGSVSYAGIKKQFNDLALSLEKEARTRILAASDPLLESIVLARVGNYIDFGTLAGVNADTFSGLFADAKASDADRRTYQSFLRQCEKGKTFLLAADNCGEIVFDRLMLEQLRDRFPQLERYVLVRGKEVLNDATPEDAAYVGLDRVAHIISNGEALAGTIYEMLPPDVRRILDQADVVLSKGQGNYESLSRAGRHAFYAFLCKCDLFTERYQVPRFTGIFIEEG